MKNKIPDKKKRQKRIGYEESVVHTIRYEYSYTE